MTEITFDAYRESYIFECSGHTGFGAAGSDILCSAVSVLCYTLGDYLNGAQDEGLVTALTEDFCEGSVRISFEADREGEREVMAAVRAVLGGFRLLEESYPDYISFTA